MEHCEPKYTATDTNHLLYHQPTDGAPHDNTPPRVVCSTATEIIYPCPRRINGALWTEIHRDRHQSFAISPTHGRSPTRQYPPRVVCITAAEIIYPCPRRINGALWTEIHRDRHQSFAISPTHGRSPTRQYPPRVVCITAAEIIYPCPRSMEHCEPKYTGTPIIHLPVGFITNPRTEPHTTIPRGCMYHSGGDYLSMPYHHIYYGISKK